MFQPLHWLITVVLDPKEQKTPGGLVLPENYAGVFVTGTVRAVGLGKPMDNGELFVPPLHPGDRVMLARHRDPRTGRPMEYPTVVDEGVLCIICDYTEIQGVVEQVKN